MIKTLYKKYNLELVAENDYEYECQQVVKNKVLTSQVAFEINKVFNLNKRPEESLILLCLNNENYITGVFEVARGNIDHVNIEISNIFKRAFACNSKRIIICHNHPSRFFSS